MASGGIWGAGDPGGDAGCSCAVEVADHAAGEAVGVIGRGDAAAGGAGEHEQ